MTKWIALPLWLGLALAAGYQLRGGRAEVADSGHLGPTIENVQQLASLVALRISISDVHLSELRGYTGSTRMVLLAKGDVQIVTDLNQAWFEAVDATRRRATLVLPPPTAACPRLDHERTRVYCIDRTGLWAFLPGQAGEAQLAGRCLQEAQRLLTQACQDPQLIAEARERCDQVLRGFFDALHWHVQIRWADSMQPTASRPAQP